MCKTTLEREKEAKGEIITHACTRKRENISAKTRGKNHSTALNNNVKGPVVAAGPERLAMLLNLIQHTLDFYIEEVLAGVSAGVTKVPPPTTRIALVFCPFFFFWVRIYYIAIL